MITLEARPPNIEGQGEVRIRELVRNALRMRPDRIIVGEVRGPETLDMLQAMNTGHEGSLTTIHANSPRDALSRLETLVMTAGVELPHRAIREQIASAFDLLVQISRLVDGSRKVTHVTEVLRMESDVITLQDIFVAKPPDEDTPVAQRGEAADAAPVQRAQAALPREAGRERRRPAVELLRARRHRVPLHDGRAELPELRMRRTVDHRPGARLRLPLRRRGERRCRAQGRRRERVPDHPRERRHADADLEAAAPARERQAGQRPARREPRPREERRPRRRPLAVDGGQAVRRRRRRRAGVPAGEAAATTGSPWRPSPRSPSC